MRVPDARGNPPLPAQGAAARMFATAHLTCACADADFLVGSGCGAGCAAAAAGDGGVEPEGPARILVESDGTLSVIPGAAHRIPALVIERRVPDRQPLRTLYCYPAEVYALGTTFYVRRPKRPGRAAHTVVIDAGVAGASVEATSVEGQPAVLLVFDG